MKSLLSILFTALIISGFSQTPDYFDSEPKWLQFSSCEEGITECELNTDRIYYVDGDTDMVSTGELYWIIREQGKSTYELADTIIPGFCEGEFVFDNLKALLRQEGRKIYCYNFNDDTDDLLYDFELGIGDTLPVTAIQIYSDVVITQVDSITAGGQWLRTFSTNSSEIEFIIEGIGHERGFLEPMYTTTDCEYEHGCYSVDGSIEWSNDIPLPNATCIYAVSAEELEEQAPILIFPNPANQHITIKGDYPAVHTFRIIDQLGRIVLTSENTNGQVDLSGLDSGIYRILIESTEGLQKASFIKQ